MYYSDPGPDGCQLRGSKKTMYMIWEVFNRGAAPLTCDLSINVNLPRTHKTVYEEAPPILHNSNTFTFVSNAQSCYNFLTSSPSRTRHPLASVAFHVTIEEYEALPLCRPRHWRKPLEHPLEHLSKPQESRRRPHRVRE
jgi:hypothetical protein